MSSVGATVPKQYCIRRRVLFMNASIRPTILISLVPCDSFLGKLMQGLISNTIGKNAFYMTLYKPKPACKAMWFIDVHAHR